MAFRRVYLALAGALGVSIWDLEHLIARLSTLDVPAGPSGPDEVVVPEVAISESPHSQIQYLLARIGKQLGCSVWIAKNDHNRTWQGQRLGELSLEQLPHLALDTESQDVVGLIDVVWLRGGKQVVAAFEVEHTTAVPASRAASEA